MGWGAYFGLATRRSGLTRWQRGDLKTLVEVPALIADIDEPPCVALPRVRAFPIPPSCIVSSGHGIHVYWLLNEPTTDMQAVNAIHRGLAHTLKGDYLTAATALRLPGSLNSKPDRNNALCQIDTWEPERHYSIAEFTPFMTPKTQRTNNQPSLQERFHCRSCADLVSEIETILIREFGGYMKPNGWLAAHCPCGHTRDRAGQHFGFHPGFGIGMCFGRHGRLNLETICDQLHLAI